MDFWKGWDAFAEAAKATEVGKMTTAAGYHPAHTGGGCFCWEKVLEDGRYLWICDEANGPGERVDESFLVGFYDKEGESLDGDTMSSLKIALEWCECRINP